MKILYAITSICQETGLRRLTFANQGRNHFATRELAEERLAAVLKNNDHNMLTQLYGDISQMRVDPIKCYDHGDSMQYYIDKYSPYLHSPYSQYRDQKSIGCVLHYIYHCLGLRYAEHCCVQSDNTITVSPYNKEKIGALQWIEYAPDKFYPKFAFVAKYEWGYGAQDIYIKELFNN